MALSKVVRQKYNSNLQKLKMNKKRNIIKIGNKRYLLNNKTFLAIYFHFLLKNIQTKKNKILLNDVARDHNILPVLLLIPRLYDKNKFL